MPDRPVASVADLTSRAELLRPKITLPETEDSWEIISKTLQSFNDLCLNGACDFPTELIATVRSISRPLTTSMVSERTRLSGVAIDLISTLAAGLGTSFEPLLQIFLPVLLSLCGRTNKVVVARARKCITNIVETTQLPSVLPYFLQSIKDKATSIRLTAAEGTLTCMNCLNPPDLEKEARAREIETIIRTTVTDAQADIRAVSRKIFEAYKLLLPNRIESFTAPLSPTTKKYLDIRTTKGRPEPPIPALDAKHPLSSSTSAMPSARTRTKSGPSVIHARSASSSALSTERQTAAANSKAPASTNLPNRQKPTKTTDMPPPPYIPVRPAQSSKVVSVSRSTSAVGARPPPASSVPVLRHGVTVAPSKPTVAPAVRPNSANSRQDIPQRPPTLTTSLSGPSHESSSGPRRVPITDTASKVAEPNKRQQGDVVRARVISAAPRPLNTDAKPTKPAAHARHPLPAREKPKPVPKVSSTQPETSSRAAESGAAAGKASKSGGAMQPTLSQLSRVKATTERKTPAAGAPKPAWGRPAANSGSSSGPSLQKGKAKTGAALENANDKPVQPSDVPLPPSPAPSAIDFPASNCQELPAPPEVPTAPVNPPINAAAVQEVARSSSRAEERDATSSASQSPGDCTVMAIEPVQKANTPSAARGDEATELTNDIQAGAATPISNQDPRTSVDAVSQVFDEKAATPRTLPLSDSIADSPTKTPISSLLSSIQRGFLFTPSSPLSPPQSYLARGPAMQGLPIPFPLSVDSSDVGLDKPAQSKKPFMFGVAEDHGRPTLGNVENLHK